MPPDMAPSALIKILKSQTSRMVHNRYKSHLQKYLWGNTPFWSSSYFAATTGTSVLEKVKEYIDSQRTPEHPRKYKNRDNSSPGD